MRIYSCRKEEKSINTTNNIKVNGSIRYPQVRVIGKDGENLGIMSAREALEKASEEGLDLIEVSPNADPPVCKIGDYGKYLYEKSKK